MSSASSEIFFCLARAVSRVEEMELKSHGMKSRQYICIINESRKLFTLFTLKT